MNQQTPIHTHDNLTRKEIGRLKTKAKFRISCNNRRARRLGAPGQMEVGQWLAILGRYGYRCVACRARRHITIDHVRPLSLGGPNTPDNVQPLCVHCNVRKGNRLIEYRPDHLLPAPRSC